MILYTKYGDKVQCIKLKHPPKINSKNNYWCEWCRFMALSSGVGIFVVR